MIMIEYVCETWNLFVTRNCFDLRNNCCELRRQITDPFFIWVFCFNWNRRASFCFWQFLWTSYTLSECDCLYREMQQMCGVSMVIITNTLFSSWDLILTTVFQKEIIIWSQVHHFHLSYYVIQLLMLTSL